MPHIVYVFPFLMCPWPGCGFVIELIDFQLEKMGDQAFYSRVMVEWGTRADFGLVGRCPGCKQFVKFGLADKQMVDDPNSVGLPVLPEDWHLQAYLA